MRASSWAVGAAALLVGALGCASKNTATAGSGGDGGPSHKDSADAGSAGAGGASSNGGADAGGSVAAAGAAGDAGSAGSGGAGSGSGGAGGSGATHDAGTTMASDGGGGSGDAGTTPAGVCNLACVRGKHCELVQVFCLKDPCPPQPQCVDDTPAPPSCGGFANLQCAGMGSCVDDPSDSCDPKMGGADCSGICQCDKAASCAQGMIWNSSPSVCACMPGSG